MSEPLLAILRLGLLALVYLFFLRVVRAVWVEVRNPVPAQKAAVPAGAVPPPPPKPAKAGPPPRASRKDRRPTQLVATEPPELQGRSFDLAGAEVVIGRDAACTITLDDTYVSSRHARLIVDGDEVRVEDLGSTNGTFVNRRKVTAPVVVRPGDRVQVGNAMLEVR